MVNGATPHCHFLIPGPVNPGFEKLHRMLDAIESLHSLGQNLIPTLQGIATSGP